MPPKRNRASAAAVGAAASKRAKSSSSSSMKVVELRAALTERGLSTDGVKAVLVARLDAADADATPVAATAADAAAVTDTASVSSASLSSSPKKPATKMVVQVCKGRAPIDHDVPMTLAKCKIKDDVHVYEHGGDGDAVDIFDAMLNQSDIGNNNNKYFVIQLLKSDTRPQFYVYFKWGRIGQVNGTRIIGPSDLTTARATFCKKFHDKTKNLWEERADFVKVKGKYLMLDRYYGDDDDDDDGDDADGAAKQDDDDDDDIKPVCALPAPVQALVQRICDTSMMKKTMMEIGYDANKLPLGKMTKAHIHKAFVVLTRVANKLAQDARRKQSRQSRVSKAAAASAAAATTEAAASSSVSSSLTSAAAAAAATTETESSASTRRRSSRSRSGKVIRYVAPDSDDSGSDDDSDDDSDDSGGDDDSDDDAQEEYEYSTLTELSNEFYSLIPHDFGMRRPQKISTALLLKAKLQMIESLADIEIATTLLKVKNDMKLSVDPITHHYNLLNCNIAPLAVDHTEHALIRAYVQETHAPTHDQYTLELLQVFSLERPSETAAFRQHATDDNRMLLWHGTRMSNYVGILSQGLRIAPPEAPSTGYMFGKGVYFSDMVSKSANYCMTSRDNAVGYLVLCEVALGECNALHEADEAANELPEGKQSTKGVGGTHPCPSTHKQLPCGTTVPIGKPVPQLCPRKRTQIQSSLLYNEFIVYDTARVRMKYLVQLKFNYKDNDYW